jgi:hypothetical protein
MTQLDFGSLTEALEVVLAMLDPERYRQVSATWVDQDGQMVTLSLNSVKSESEVIS